MAQLIIYNSIAHADDRDFILADIDYSLRDSHVRKCEIRNEVLFDESSHIVVEGWRDRLYEFVKKQKLDVDKGDGLCAFVYKLLEDYE